MVFYFAVIPMLVMTIVMLVQMLKAKKHDVVLFNFCGIRREAMSLVRARGFDMAEDDYNDIRELVAFLNTTIAGYKEHRIAMFNFREIRKAVNNYKENADTVELYKRSGNEDIDKLYDKTAGALLLGFLSYTPLIKQEIIVNIVMGLVKIMAMTGVHAFKEYERKLSGFINLLDEQIRKYGCEIGMMKGCPSH